MKRNPFWKVPVIAVGIFLIVLVVADHKPCFWIVWPLYLLGAVALPIGWQMLEKRRHTWKNKTKVRYEEAEDGD